MKKLCIFKYWEIVYVKANLFKTLIFKVQINAAQRIHIFQRSCLNLSVSVWKKKCVNKGWGQVSNFQILQMAEITSDVQVCALGSNFPFCCYKEEPFSLFHLDFFLWQPLNLGFSGTPVSLRNLKQSITLLPSF